jgi:hypothetical protein
MKILTGRWLVAGVMVISGFTWAASALSPSAAYASSAARVCSNTQLEVAVAESPGAAAGHIGIPFIIANIGKTACTLKGYPKLGIAYSYKKRSVKVDDGGGMVFVAVKPRVVTLQPGSDASFGFNYVDAADQQDPNGAACTAQDVEISLPVRNPQFATNFELPLTFNFCYSGFEVAVTSIQAGPLPKIG